MESNNEFKEDAEYVVSLLEASIENVGFPKSEKDRLEEFFEYEYGEKEKDIQTRLISIYMAFLGKTDFKYAENEKNEQLFRKLLAELEKIKLELSSL
ncbi:hypothetical protein J2T15_004096 [Paenibacillus harenae]|uniref:Colicin D immunity protein domain-containing protein n=2 Tax=Paenibacillus harenae TaxID=306543 RepID=A0ABT9U7G0_PAEHA|nr:hypothetical protein [Paenibacillus harenae]